MSVLLCPFIRPPLPPLGPHVSPLSRDAGFCLSCPRSSMTRVGPPCGSDSWYSTPLLFRMLSLAGFSLPGIFHGSVPGLGLGDGTRVSGRGHSVKLWALPVLAAVPSRSQLSLVRSKLTSHPAHEMTKAERCCDSPEKGQDQDC